MFVYFFRAQGCDPNSMRYTKIFLCIIFFIKTEFRILRFGRKSNTFLWLIVHNWTCYDDQYKFSTFYKKLSTVHKSS